MHSQFPQIPKAEFSSIENQNQSAQLRYQTRLNTLYPALRCLRYLKRLSESLTSTRPGVIPRPSIQEWQRATLDSHTIIKLGIFTTTPCRQRRVPRSRRPARGSSCWKRWRNEMCPFPTRSNGAYHETERVRYVVGGWVRSAVLSYLSAAFKGSHTILFYSIRQATVSDSHFE